MTPTNNPLLAGYEDLIDQNTENKNILAGYEDLIKPQSTKIPDEDEIRQWLKGFGRENAQITPEIAERFKRFKELGGLEKQKQAEDYIEGRSVLSDTVGGTLQDIGKGIKTFSGGAYEVTAGTLKQVSDLATNFAQTQTPIPNPLFKETSLPNIATPIIENMSRYGDQLIREGIKPGLIQKIVKAAGEAAPILLKLMATSGLGHANLPLWESLDALNEKDLNGVLRGATRGLIMSGGLELNKMLPKAIQPITAGVGFAAVTPGGAEEKIASGLVGAGLALPGAMGGGRRVTPAEIESSRIAGRKTLDQYQQELDTAALQKLELEKQTGIKAKEIPIVFDKNQIKPTEPIEKPVVKPPSIIPQSADKKLPTKKITSGGIIIKPGEIKPPEFKPFIVEQPKIPARGIGRTTKDIYRKWIYAAEDVDKTIRAAEKKGTKLTPEQNPLYDYSEFLKASGKTKAWIETKFNPIYKKLIANVKSKYPNLDDGGIEKIFNEYRIARRFIDDFEASRENKKGLLLVGNTKYKHAIENVKSIEQQYGRAVGDFASSAKEIRGIDNLDRLVESGVKSQAEVAAMKKENPFYIPTQYLIDEMIRSGDYGMEELNSLKRRVGTEREEILDPSHQEILNYSIIEKLAKINEVKTKLYGIKKIFGDRMDDIKFGRAIEKISYKVDGKSKEFYVSPEIKDMVSSLEPYQANSIVKFSQTPTKIFQTATTADPVFGMGNFIRDQFAGYVHSKHGIVPFYDAIKAIATIIKKPQIYYDYLNSGSAITDYMDLAQKNWSGVYEKLLKKPSLLRKLNVVEHLQQLNTMLEMSTRLGEFKKAIDRGVDIKIAAKDAAEVTVDWTRRGSSKSAYQTMGFYPFMRASAQALDRTRIAFRDAPVKTSMRIAMPILAAEILSFMLNKDNSAYKEAKDWEKDIFWFINIGGTLVKISKPQIYGQLIGSALGRFLRYTFGKDPDAFKKYEQLIIRQLTPIDPDAGAFIVQILKPAVESLLNYKFFQNTPIVPEDKKNLMPYMQYTKETPELLKDISNKLNDIGIQVSPAKIQHLIKGYGGRLADTIMSTIELAYRGIAGKNKTKRPIELSDIPIAKGFVTQSHRIYPQSLQKFYELRNKVTPIYNTYQKLRKEELDIKILDAFYDKHEKEIEAYDSLDDIGKELKQINKDIDSITKKSLDVTLKRKLLNDLYDKRIHELEYFFNKYQNTENKNILIGYENLIKPHKK